MTRGVVVDLDGTVLSGDSLLDGAADALAAVRDAGRGVLFLTNNPTRPPAEYAQRLTGLGVDARPEEVLTATSATIDYLREHHADESVFAIAEASVTDQLRDAGVSLVADARRADTVVVGYDREFAYDDMVAALRAFDAGADALVGTDPDITVPTPDGPVPGSGAIIDAVANVVERDPDAVLGKPSDVTARLALDRLDLPAAECVLVGDRLDTDIAMGNRVGMTTVLVRTGVTDDETLAASPVQPDYVRDSLADARDLL
ncbi:HAD-IIA family hydrolase [Salarchaeum japonicum]|uniref:HAD-IIA family hydrolase n=1 Tax=Salarchaeum japonicum TaxID=555573 RepID=A0AAV3T1X0_9EURY|nr:HAD-IIA family hydrolase [Salarchaeum japonicum]